jgi:N-acetylglucosamine kinase-like BadF-type ATPase
LPALHSGALVGLDVGGTKTHLRAIRQSEVISDTVVPSGDWTVADVDKAAARLCEVIEHSLPPSTEISALAVGANGCDSALRCLQLQTALERALRVPCLVRNDAELLVPAAGLTAGIGLVAGTGSVAVGRAADGSPVFVGGWGWLLGDEGSASGLLREATKASLAARDRGEQPDLLAELLLRSYGVAEVADLPDRMAAEPGAGGWGRRATLVFQALEGGSALAAHVVEEGAAALARMVAGVHSRAPGTPDVVVAGGVILRQESLFTAFERRLSAVLPSVRIHRLAVAPVHGAVRLAERLAGARGWAE